MSAFSLLDSDAELKHITTTSLVSLTRMSCSRLPPEIWIKIYRWAIFSVFNDCFYATEYEPFRSAAGCNSNILDRNLKVKWALVRVCRWWRAMAMDLLYEDVRVRHYGEEILADVLDSTGDCEGYGKWVRRIELPYATTAHQYFTSISILERCPKLQVLVRPPPGRAGDLYFHSDAKFVPPLTSLKRLEWWSASVPANGMHSIHDVLGRAPNLRYLSLGGPGSLSIAQPQPRCHLPVLTTLSFRLLDNTFIQQMCHWSMPALANVVVDYPQRDTLYWTIWETFGLQLRVVELGKNLEFFRADHITPILLNCPNLQELSFYINFAMPPRSSIVHSSLRCVRLHGDVCIFGNDWRYLDKYLAWFSGSSVPALRQIVLYGDWSHVLISDELIHFQRAFVTRGGSLELPDGTLITL